MVFNSRNEKFKTPYGAVATEQEFTINFPLPGWVKVNEVLLVLRKKEQNFYTMSFSGSEGGYNIYSVTMSLKKEGIYYYSFRVFNEFGMFNYGRDRFMNAVCGENLPEWQLTVYNKNYKTPDEFKGGIIYHIFADRFNRAEGVNVTRTYRMHEDWYENPVAIENDGSYRADDFFGGNLKGITQKLDYLKELGVTLIYLSPIFRSSSNHRYDTGDYMQIDELLGTEEDFDELISEAGKRGMGIMLDGVFNHTGADSIYFNKFGNYDSLGAYQSKKSPYYKWYTFQHYPDTYTCWWGVTVTPTVAHNNRSYRNFIMGDGGVIEKWTKKGIKGWRLDVVDELPIEFVDGLRKKIKELNPSALIIGEVWEDASNKVSYDLLRPYLLGSQLDGVMNYPFRTAILDYVMWGDINEFKLRIWEITENYPRQTIDCLMNVIDTHDTVRAINRLSTKDITGTTKSRRMEIMLSPIEYNFAKQRLCLAVMLQFTLPGIPSIYYGDEAGVQGYEDPINRRTYPWGREDVKLLEYYKKIAAIRTANRDMFTGEFRILDNYDILAYTWTKGDRKLLIVSNNSPGYVNMEIPADGVNLLDGKQIYKGDYAFAPYEFSIISIS